MAPIINLKVNSDFKAASADLKKFGTVTAQQAKKLEKFQAQFKSDSINNFIDRNNRATAAIKATRGPVAALTSQYKAYQRQIETLIRRGLDPESKEIKELTGRYKKLEREIEDVGKAQAKNQKRLQATKGAMLAVGAGAVLMGKQAVSAFIDFSKASAKAASDAEEIKGKFNVVFRDISDDATDAAATIAKDFDLANSTVNKLLGDTGDILTGLGFDQETALELSTSVGTLALDLASFTNFAGGAEGASAALTKALLGEAESAKALGIVIRQDTDEYKAMVKEQMEVNGLTLIQAKAMTALKISTEQSKNAIGDYARTINSTANVQRRLEESQKSLTEAWGVGINTGLTPLRAALTTIIDKWTALLVKQNAARAFLDDIKDGSVDSKLSLQELQDTLAGLEANREKFGPGAVDKQIREVEALIVAYGVQDTFLIQAADSARVLAQVGIDAAAKTKVLTDANADALKEFKANQLEALTGDQKRIIIINAQIDHLAALKKEAKAMGTEWAGIETLLVSLLKEKGELLDNEAEKVERNRTAVVAAGEDWLSQEQAKIDHLIWIDEKEQEIAENRAAAAAERQEEFKAMAATISGFVSGPLEALGAAMVSGEDGWKDLGKAAIASLAGVIRALGEQALVQAAIAFATPGGIATGFAFAGAATAAFIAAGAVGASANKLAEGGSFETAGPTPLLVGDNLGGREKVTVEPISSTGRNEGGGGQAPIIIQLLIDGEEFTAYQQRQHDNQAFRIPEKEVVRT